MRRLRAAETALARLTATPAPDLAAFGDKLGLMLDAANVPAETIDAIAADVRRLARREAQA